MSVSTPVPGRIVHRPAHHRTADRQCPADQAGTASGVLNTCRQVGGSLGVAAFGAVLAAQASFLHGLHVSYLTAAVLLTITAAASTVLPRTTL